VIFDYKTGSARTEKQVRTGLAPQLTLEAAILREGGFPNIPGGSVKDIAYVLLKGGEPPGDTRVLSFKEGSADSHAERALEKLKQLAKSFANESMPYYSLVHPMWSTYYGAYDHLARVKEWSSVGRDDDDFWNGA
jgi:ATP-dependent helicase/nuclease subunit B